MKNQYLFLLLLLSGCYSSASDPLQRVEIDTVAEDVLEFTDYQPQLSPVEVKQSKVFLTQKSVISVRGNGVFDVKRNEMSAIFFVSGLAIDADGSPRAYHPDNTGLDLLKNAGTEGNWWALATENGQKDGKPVIQGENDPYPGYYVSMTSLSYPDMPDTDPKKYVNAEDVCYFVLPPSVKNRADVWLGDFGLVYNFSNKKYAFAIFADIGPVTKLGEGSIKLAEELGVNASPKVGGVPNNITYLIFPNSGNNQPRTQAEIDKEGKKALENWGGLKLFTDGLDELVKQVVKDKKGK